MPAALERVRSMSLDIRGAELQRIVAATEVTDLAGKRSDAEAAFARIFATLASPGDVLIALSSSGQSANMGNARAEMRTLGDVNIWLDSTDYGMVEIGHQFVLHNIADRIRLGM